MISINNIRSAKGFNELPQDLKRFYIEFVYDVVADEFTKFDRISVDRVDFTENTIHVTFLKRVDDFVKEYKFCGKPI